MKQFYLISFILLIVSGCVAGEYNAPANMRVMPDTAHRSYQFTTSTDVARIGETSQRFEIRHGDCGNWDCNNDRRRIELNQYNADDNVQSGDKVWYGYSIYLPTDFQDITPSNTHVGQAKIIGGSPLWMFALREDRLIFENNVGETDTTNQCPTISQTAMRGRWTDIVVFADYDKTPSGNPMVAVWVNGRQVCTDNRPMLSSAIIRDARRDAITMRYGIYNSFVSRWLNDNRTQQVITNGFVDNNSDGGSSRSRSVTGTPFKIDWGVELLTQVVYYDEVRIGRTREDVDVRLRYPN